MRKFFTLALEVLRQNQELFSTFVENRIGFEEAEEVRSGSSGWRVVTLMGAVLQAV